jgi:hypothetical protein
MHPPPTNSDSSKDAPAGCMKRLVRLSDAVRALDGDLGRQVRALEIQLEAAKNRHCFCPDCRDKVRDEECLRCQVQRLTRKLRKYEPNTPDQYGRFGNLTNEKQ